MMAMRMAQAAQRLQSLRPAQLAVSTRGMATFDERERGEEVSASIVASETTSRNACIAWCWSAGRRRTGVVRGLQHKCTPFCTWNKGVAARILDGDQVMMCVSFLDAQRVWFNREVRHLHICTMHVLAKDPPAPGISPPPASLQVAGSPTSRFVLPPTGGEAAQEAAGEDEAGVVVTRGGA